MLPVLPPSTGMLTPFTYDAAGEARKAATAAISEASANRFIGTSASIFFSTTAAAVLPRCASVSISVDSRLVDVNPGNTLFTVILKCPSSFAIVLAQLATAPRMVFETPRFFSGILTEVEITFTMRPYCSFFIEGTTAFASM